MFCKEGRHASSIHLPDDRNKASSSLVERSTPGVQQIQSLSDVRNEAIAQSLHAQATETGAFPSCASRRHNVATGMGCRGHTCNIGTSLRIGQPCILNCTFSPVLGIEVVPCWPRDGAMLDATGTALRLYLTC